MAGTSSLAPTEGDLGANAGVAPFTVHELGFPVVDVIINGEGPYRFLLDTGSAVTTMLERVGDELCLPASVLLKNRTSVTRGAKRITYSRVARIESLQIGDIVFRNLDVNLRDKFPFCQDIAGVLGYDAFRGSGLQLTLDFPKGRLQLASPRLEKLERQIFADYSKGVPIIAVAIGLDTPHPFRARMVVDTGCTGGLVLPEKMAHEFPDMRPTHVGKVGMADSDYSVQEYTLNHDVLVGYGVHRRLPVMFYGKTEGLIGMVVLKGYVVILDTAGQRASLILVSK
jgi:predicted aspartyl protease